MQWLNNVLWVICGGLSLHVWWMKTAADSPRWLAKLFMLRAVKELVNESTLPCFISKYIWFVTVALLSREKGVCAQQELGSSFPAKLVALVVGLRVVGLLNCSALFLSYYKSGLGWPQGGGLCVSFYSVVGIPLENVGTALQLIIRRWLF